ncbi:MAG: hypothetical protein LBU46_02860 [Candidatus Accumulibacter sp.]|jgi:hypothetical protein|nr:hypothetical protein [Accumulibacter sp.]
MSFQPLGFLSGLAYLALCLLIAASGARKKCRFDFSDPAEASTIGQLAGESGQPPPVSRSPKSSFLLSVSCLISLSSFLFMPCGTLPSLFPDAGGALIALGGLAAALGFRGCAAMRRQGCVALCLGVSLAVIARYAQQRGVPGELYALDAYVAMPIVGVAEGGALPGVCILALASLFALRQASPARNANPLGGGEALLAALAAELWMLAAIGFWVGLFFPFSFAFGQLSEVSALGGLALNALVFWGKVLGLEWLLGKLREKWPHDTPRHASILVALLALGVWLLLDAAAG